VSKRESQETVVFTKTQWFCDASGHALLDGTRPLCCSFCDKDICAAHSARVYIHGLDTVTVSCVECHALYLTSYADVFRLRWEDYVQERTRLYAALRTEALARRASQ